MTSRAEGRAGRDVLITGPSRSGTTLTCELLNQVRDAVALDEPMNARSMLGHEVPDPSAAAVAVDLPRRVRSLLRAWRDGTRPAPRKPPAHDAVCDSIERFLVESRHSITTRGVALSRNVGGKVVGKKVADEYGDRGLRLRLADLGEIAVDKPLSADFLLAIKQTSGFIALLDSLVRRFEVYALVRNPLAVITSWQSLPFHPQDGHVRLGEGIDWELRARLAAIPDRIDRQFEILAWYFGRIQASVPAAQVIRYEDLVASPGRALGAVTEHARELRTELQDRNRNRSVHDRELVRTLGERLLATDGPWWHFYTEDAVRELLSA